MKIRHPSKHEYVEYETDPNAIVIINAISDIYFLLDNKWNKKLIIKLSDTENEMFCWELKNSLYCLICFNTVFWHDIFSKPLWYFNKQQ